MPSFAEKWNSRHNPDQAPKIKTPENKPLVHPDREMSYYSIPALQLLAAGNSGEARTATSAAIVQTELSDLRLPPEVKRRAKTVLAQIVEESFDLYQNANDDEARGEVVKNASYPGIRLSDTLVTAVTGESHLSAADLLQRADLTFLISIVGDSLREKNIDWNTLNQDVLAAKILEEANSDEYASPEKRAIVGNIVSKREPELSQPQAFALQLIATGIHDSWAAIQPSRTMQDTPDDAHKMLEEYKKIDVQVPDELFEEYRKLRIMRDVYKSFPAMQRAKFEEGVTTALSAEDPNTIESGVAKAIYEILKDLVQIGLSDENEVALSEPFPEQISLPIRERYIAVRKQAENLLKYVPYSALDKLLQDAITSTREINLEKVQPLFDHLRETEYAAATVQKFVQPLRDAAGQPYLSVHQLDLLTQQISPAHDLLKLLGAPNEQNLSDHEILIGRFVRQVGQQMGLSAETIHFIAGVLENHENINKEGGRTEYSASNEPVDRAVAIMGMLDCFGASFVPVERKTKNGTILELGLDDAKLQQRFTDLAVRHIDRAKMKLPAPRPEWLVSTVTDFLHTLHTLYSSYGLRLHQEVPWQILGSGLKAIDETLEAQATYPEEKRLTQNEIQSLLKAGQDLQALATHPSLSGLFR